jgi:hypothetical protein
VFFTIVPLGGGQKGEIFQQYTYGPLNEIADINEIWAPAAMRVKPEIWAGLLNK